MMRVATAAEVAQMLDWAADEGWNPGLGDAWAFRAADPGGFFVALRDGAPVAAISVVNHSDSFAFLGLYLCRPDWRGQGIGLALWTHALAHAGGRTVGLDGVAQQQANYARSGFAPAGATLRMEGAVDWPGAGVAPDRTRIAALDRAATGVARPAFLGAWCKDTATRRTVMLRSGGFATGRACRDGCKVGPVVAPDAASALTLIAAASNGFDQRRVIVDVPDTQPALLAELRKRGFAETFRTARMYRGPAPRADGTLWAGATLELG